MTDKELMLISYAHSQVDSDFARMHWRTHCDPHTIEMVELLLYQISILESREQYIGWQLQSLPLSYEF